VVSEFHEIPSMSGSPCRYPPFCWFRDVDAERMRIGSGTNRTQLRCGGRMFRLLHRLCDDPLAGAPGTAWGASMEGAEPGGRGASFPQCPARGLWRAPGPIGAQGRCAAPCVSFGSPNGSDKTCQASTPGSRANEQPGATTAKKRTVSSVCQTERPVWQIRKIRTGATIRAPHLGHLGGARHLEKRCALRICGNHDGLTHDRRVL